MPIPHHPTPGSPPDILLKNRDGSPHPIAPHAPLPADRARFVGEPVAMVVAETVHAAMDAAERVEVHYQPLPSVASARSAVEAGAPALYGDLANVCIDADDGDLAATTEAFARAAYVVRLKTWVQRVTGVRWWSRARQLPAPILRAVAIGFSRRKLLVRGYRFLHGPALCRANGRITDREFGSLKCPGEFHNLSLCKSRWRA
jgi:hypothetical protein